MLKVTAPIYFPALFFFVGVTSACHIDMGREKEDVWTPPTTEQEIVFGYALEDADCRDQQGVESIEQGQFFSLQNAAVNPVQQSLYGLSSSPSLKGEYVRSTGYGMETITQCEKDGDRASCSDVATIEKNPAPLKICRQDANYQRESLEGISITSIVALERFFRFYHSLPDRNAGLETVDLLIMPNFISKFPTYASPKVDNLSYYPSLTDFPTIVVFPKGNFGRSIWPDVNLWEAPWILSHEGAHHVFRTQFASTHPDAPSDLMALIESPAPVLHLPEAGLVHKHEEAAGDGNGLTKRDIVGAVNEGFADLMAYYGLGEKSKLDQLTCFAKSRDVNSAVFVDNQPKILSRKALDRFQGFEADAVTGACTSTNYRDIHNIGAIIVYGLNRIFAEVSTVRTSNSPSWAKANLALKWVKSMPSDITPDEAGLMALVKAGINAATDTQGQLNAAQCTALQQVFPTLSEHSVSSWGCH